MMQIHFMQTVCIKSVVEIEINIDSLLDSEVNLMQLDLMWSLQQ